MKLNKYIIIILIFCFFILINSSFAISNDTNINHEDSNDKIIVSNDTIESSSNSLKIPIDKNIKNDSNNNSNKILTSSKKKVKTKIIANDVTKYFGEKITIKAKLKNSKDKLLSGKKIKIKCDGKTWTKKTNSKGVVKLDLQKPIGKYTIKFEFKQTGYQSCSKKITLNVKPMEIKLSVQNTVFVYDENNELKVYLKDKNNKNLAKKKISIKFQNTIYEKTTNSKGIVTLNIKANPNTYNITFSFNEKNYVKTNINIPITIKPIPTNLKVDDLICNYDDNVDDYLNITLTSKNTPLNGKIINFNINGKNITVKTNKSGQAKLKITENPGKYKVNISFSDKLYETIKKSVYVNVISYIPSVNYKGGFYKESNLNLTLNINNASFIKYSWDNEHWNYSNKTLTYDLKNGIYDLYYSNSNEKIYHEHYIIDDESPLVWSNYDSDIYDSTIIVNLTTWDNLDNNPKIYYTLNGKNPLTDGIIYEKPIIINETTTLKFYSIDFNEIKSNVTTCNYMFNCSIANLNSGKKFTSIQTAIDDENTINGDTIKIASGTYNTNLIINKNLNLIGNANKSVEFRSLSSSTAIIKILPEGSNSLIYGITFKNSNYGIVLEKTENVTILDNIFKQCKQSIECCNDTNTLIYNNKISCPLFLSQIVGIKSRTSENLIISSNDILLNSDKNSIAIILTDEGKNINIKNNSLNNLNLGVGIFIYAENLNMENNTISNFMLGIEINSINSTFINNQIYNNLCGLRLMFSGLNTYKSNNIYNNKEYGVCLNDFYYGRGDKFYLNRLCDNGKFDFYSTSNITYVIDNNWWGNNNPQLSNNENAQSNIYDEKSNLILNSWIVINSFATSYELDENNLIKRAKIYLETNYNNLGEDLSNYGYIPNNLDIFFKCDKNEQKSLLKNGISFADFNLKETFKTTDAINISAKLDNQNFSFILNRKALIDTAIFSSAIDISTGQKVNINYSIEYLNTTWITYSWAETGLYTGALFIIVNGKIVKTINITNEYYKIYKNQYRKEVFEIIKAFNELFASTKEGIWSPNDLYLTFAKNIGANPTNISIIEKEYLDYAKIKYKLTNSELKFIKDNSKNFVDSIIMMINYHGDFGKKININYNNEYELIKMPEFVIRASNIYYTNILDENSNSIGYEGMRSFAIAKNKVNKDNLKYWLDKKDLYSPGMMKASYGTFLTSLLVLYENDNIAGKTASELNLTWNRISPTCVSLCNDFNCLYITGESDHTMGREAIGDKDNVLKFNFITSSAFSLNEQLVSNNVWNDTTIGSVTLGLFQNYMNNETLEIFKNNEMIFIKNQKNNNSMLIIDLETGIVRDIFNYYGILGTMPCYHDNITENAWKYGNKLLNDIEGLDKVFNIGMLTTAFFEGAELIGIGVLEASFVFTIIALPLLMFFCPDEVNKMWKDFIYFFNPNYKDYPNIPIYEKFPPEKPKKSTPIVLNGKSLDEYISSEFKKNRGPDKNTYTLLNNKNLNEKNGKIPYHPGKGGGDKPDKPNQNNWENVGKYLKDTFKEFKSLKTNQERIKFLKSHIKELFTIALAVESIESIQTIIYLITTWACREDK